MDNIEEVQDAAVIDTAIEDIAKFKLGDTVWVKTQKSYGIIIDRNIDKDTDNVIYRVQLAPDKIQAFLTERMLYRPNTLR